MVPRNCVVCVALIAIGGFALSPLFAQGAPLGEGVPQSEVASKSVKFDVIAKTARAWREAKEAVDLKSARAALGKPTMFKGTVSQVVAGAGNVAVTLQFAKDAKSAVRAVVRKEHFARFPRLDELKGKTVVFTSKVLDSADGLEVELVRPGQLKVVE